jgi:hypothetical protein
MNIQSKHKKCPLNPNTLTLLISKQFKKKRKKKSSWKFRKRKKNTSSWKKREREKKKNTRKKIHKNNNFKTKILP